MFRLPQSLQAWNAPEFSAVLKQEVERTGSGYLPLQQGLSMSSHVLDAPLSVMVLSVSDAPGCIHARIGVFFSGIIGGCSCADDPTPVEPQNEYCEMLLAIDKKTAETSVTL